MKQKDIVQIELCKFTGLKPKEGEDRQKFLVRLAKAINKKSEREYKKLSNESHKWYQAAAQAAANGEDLPDTVPPEPKKKLLKLKLKKKAEAGELPGWSAIHKMEEDALADLAEEHGIDIDQEFEDMGEVADYIAKELGVKKPKPFLKKKAKKAGEDEEEESDLPSWQEVHAMGDRALGKLADKHKLKLKAEYDSLEDVQDDICHLLDIEPKVKKTVPKKLPARKPTGTQVKAKKKPAEKKPEPKQPTKRELERQKKIDKMMSSAEKALRKIGFKGEPLQKGLSGLKAQFK